ncbi:J domain-containing protein [Nocardioides sp.]|uniref:J domain-containing protein n=1 Tax=Nocardioides sp. TaxID=35761 RepID=UPI00378396A6
MSPSWYDLLGVAPDASAEEVRGAWRTAIADLDPTDRRFAALNQAAQVLLDPQRRAAYDAELAAAAALAGPTAEADLAEPDHVAATPEPETDRAGRRGVPAWLLVGLAVAVLVVAGVGAWLDVTTPSDRSVEDATSAAQSAAERAVVPILSYDATSLDQSKAAAEQYLTGDYRSEYDKLFEGVIRQNAPSTKTVVTAQLVRSGIVRSGDDRVQVFLLVNQTRTNAADDQPTIYKNWVTMTMEKVGDDWLVAGMDT